MAKKEKQNNKQKRHFFKDMKAELKKVIWPTPKQTANNTLAVIAFTVSIAVVVFALDLVFEFGSKKVTGLQSTIKSSYSSNATEENTSNENSSSEENATEESGADAEVEVKTENSSNTESQE